MLSILGELNFRAETLAGTLGTQWVSIDSGDIDADGDVDILLGAINVTPELSEQGDANFQKAIKSQPSLLLLKNGND